PGAVCGSRLLEVLRGVAGVEAHLVVSREARRIIPEETDYRLEAVEALAAAVYDDRDTDAAPASGSFGTSGMVVAPCDVGTLSALAHSPAGTLIARAGDVTLEEGRPLVLVARETPLHLRHPRAMLALAQMGAAILPPLPAFYPRPRTLDDVVNHTVGRVLDRFGIPHDLVSEWTGSARSRRHPDPGSEAP